MADFDPNFPNQLRTPLAILAGGEPTAKLHLGASGSGESNSASLKFNQGTLLVNPEDGAMEYANGHLYFTVGTTRTQIV